MNENGVRASAPKMPHKIAAVVMAGLVPAIHVFIT
jgi:hypothetical protein